MKNVLKKYSGVLFLYLVIVGMVLLINARFNYLNPSLTLVVKNPALGTINPSFFIF